MFAGNFEPQGWKFCAGQLEPISENETLFQLIGTTYGGDGVSTFGLPDLQGRLPLHQGTLAGQTFQLAEMGGTEVETLTVQQIPNHSHAFMASTSVGSSPSPNGNVVAASGSTNLYRPGPAAAAMAASMVGVAGGSQPHSNFQPYLCLNFIISLYGVFPTQT